jgi:tRNA (cytidine/uridine-2'-O-)-methyltransferase
MPMCGAAEMWRRIVNSRGKMTVNTGLPDGVATLHIALVRPEIHPNTGNIARLCAANSVPLHIVGKAAFRLDDRSVRRAGLDYWPYVDLRREKDLQELMAAIPESRLFYFSARAGRQYTAVSYTAGDCLVFGPESRGLPDELLAAHPEHSLVIPMRSEHVRSLNLATAVAIAMYEALRQFRVLESSRLCDIPPKL